LIQGKIHGKPQGTAMISEKTSICKKFKAEKMPRPNNCKNNY
jgi:hypothetical protein